MQGYNFRLKPKHLQAILLNESLGANRFVWNKLLSLNLYRLENKLPLIWHAEMCKFITFWKKTEERSFLKTAPSQSLQQTAKALDRAFRDAFDKNQPNKRIPRFKRAGRSEAGVKFPQGVTLDENNQVIFFPKLGWVKYIKSRKIEGTIKNVTITRHAGKYFVSIQTEREVAQPQHPAKTAIGIDMGIKRFATLSDGTVVEPISSFKSVEEKLAKEQRKLKNKVKFSSNWKKQQSVIREIYTKIAYVRNDFLHKSSNNISKSHAMIVLEDLKISNMSKSAKGTLDNPGRQVKQKSGLNKAILDQGWGEFRRQLEYKQQWRGGIVLAVPPQYTSQTCPCCAYVSKENRKTQAGFLCIDCGYQEHADLVAALNILRAGHARLACEVSAAPRSTSSRNQLSAAL
jgi:putative transposase